MSMVICKGTAANGFRAYWRLSPIAGWLCVDDPSRATAMPLEDARKLADERPDWELQFVEIDADEAASC